MTTLLDLIAALAWWAMLAGFAGLATVLIVAVFMHAYPEGGDDAE